jgi:hypothetical protein
VTVYDDAWLDQEFAAYEQAVKDVDDNDVLAAYKHLEERVPRLLDALRVTIGNAQESHRVHALLTKMGIPESGDLGPMPLCRRVAELWAKVSQAERERDTLLATLGQLRPAGAATDRQHRTAEELREALGRMCEAVWSRTRQSAMPTVFTIPVDHERDADCILADGITELLALRERIKEVEERLRETQVALLHQLFDQHQHSSRPCETCERSRKALGGVEIGCARPWANRPALEAALAAKAKEDQT